MKSWLRELCIILAGLAPGCSCNAVLGDRPATTIYVGRHFEVRDYDQPTKYVFNGNIRVARITGSLAPTQRIQRFRLYSGWNLLSLAISAPNVFYQITNALPALVSSGLVFRWDEPTSAWSPLSPDQPLGAGAILWLYSDHNSSLALTGAYQDPTNRYVDWDGKFLPAAGLEAWDLASVISKLPSASAWSYDSSVTDWLSWLPSPLDSPSTLPAMLAPGSAVFVRAAASAELEVPDSALRIRYYHEDHLGSSTVATDAGGEMIEEAAYHPFGATRNAFEPRQAADPYGFGQKERDRETGLHYFEARYMAAALARFATVDEKYANPDALSSQDSMAFLAHPQQLSLYAYVENRPIKLTDPTGLGTWAEPWMFPEYRRSTAEIEIDWDWFGRQARKLENAYRNLRNQACLWPLENCDIDWKRTRHPLSWLSIDRGEQTGKPVADPSPKPEGTPTTVGGQPGVPTEAQKKVLSVIARVVKGVDDLLSNSQASQQHPQRFERDKSPNPQSKPPAVQRVQEKQEKYQKVEIGNITASASADSSSPR